jgi:hypothetical protein
MKRLIIIAVIGVIVTISIAYSLNNYFAASEKVRIADQELEESKRELEISLQEAGKTLQACIEVNGYNACRTGSINQCVALGRSSYNECTETFELVMEEISK